MEKKKATKAVTKKVEATTKSAPVKEEVKKVVEVVAEKKVTESDVAEKKVTEKKVAGKKTTAKQTTAKKAEMVPEVFVQFSGNEAAVATVIEKAKQQFVEGGHRVSTIKSLQVYMKPEEYAAYYVINQKHHGKVDLF